MPRPRKLKDGKCPRCQGSEFYAPYTEQAFQKFVVETKRTVAAKEDGYNVQEHYVELGAAECADCNQKVDLSDMEII